MKNSVSPLSARSSVRPGRRGLSGAFLLGAAALLTVGAATAARAATYYWDVNGATAGSGGTGNWTGANWTTTAGGTTATATATIGSSDAIVFEAGGTAGTITLSNNVSVNSISDSVGMTFGSSNKVSLGGTSPSVTIGAVTTSMSTELAISAGSTVTVASGGSLLLNGVLSGSGSLTKSGAGLLSIAGTSGYSGTVTLSAGTLKLSSQSVLSRGVLSMSGGSLVFDSGATSYSIGMLTASAAGAGYDIALVNNAGSPAAVALSIGDSNTNRTGTYAGVLSGTGSLTVKNGANLTLSGANTYSGGTTVSDGTLKLGASERLLDAGTVTVNDSGNGSATFDLNGNTETTATVNLTNSGGNNGIGSASITNGTLVVNGPNTYNVQGGTISASLTGSAVLNKSTSDTVILSGGNTYTGATSVNAGTLRLYKDTSLYNDVTANWTASNLKVAGGATLWVRVGGTGEFTSADLDVLLSLGTATGGFLGNSTIAFDTTNGDFTYGTVIADTNGGSNKLNLTKTQTGTLTLTAANTYTGVTTVNGGTLSVASINDGGVAGNLGAATGAAANIVIDGATLKYTGAGETIARGFSVTNNGGTLDASGTGALVVNGNGVDGGFAAPGSGTRTLTLRGASTSLNTLGSTLVDASGSATSLAKDDTGTWLLTAANTFTGGTSVKGGTLRLHNQLALQNSTVTMMGSALKGGYLIFDQSVVANAFTLGALASASAGVGFDITLMNNAGTPAPIVLTVGGNNATTTYAGVLSGQGQLVKRGTGVMTLTGTSTYTGATTIYAGKLSVSVINNGGVAGNLGAATSDPANLVLDGGTLLYTGANASTDRNFTLGVNGGTIEANGSGPINFLGTPTIVVDGARTLTLRGTNSGNNTLTGVLPDAASGLTSLTKTDSGKWVVAGLNTYTGVTTISGGILAAAVINNGGVAGNLGAATSASSNIVIDGGTLLYTGAGETTDRGFSVGANGGTVDASGTGALTFTGNVPSSTATGSRTLTLTGSNVGQNTLTGVVSDPATSGALSLTKAGAGTWVLTAANTYSGVTTISGGILSVATLANGGTASHLGKAAVAAGNLVIDGGTLLFTGAAGTTNRGFTVGANGATLDASGSAVLVFTGATASSGSGARTLTLTGSNTDVNRIGGALVDPSSGALSLTKSAAGTWVLSGNNTFSGATTVGAGTLVLAATLAEQNSTVTMTGGTLIFDSSVASGNFTAGGLAAASAGAGYDITLANNAGTPAAVTFSVGNNNASTTYAGVLSGLGGLTKIGTGTLTLSNANTYLSGTSVSGGSLKLANALAVQNSTVTLGGGSIVFDSSVVSRAFTFGGLAAASSGAGYNLALQNNAGTPAAVALTVGGNNASTTYAGVLSGAGSLTKVGTGTLTLTGANTYSGATTVSAGTVTASSGSLGGTSGLTVSAGTLNAVNFNASASLAVSAGATANVSGTGLTLSGAITNNGALNFTGVTGTVTVGSIGGTSGTTSFSSNASVTSGISAGTVNVTGALTSSISGGTVTAGSLTAATVSGAATSVTVAGAATIGTLSAGTVNLNGATASITTLNGGTVNLGSTVLTVSGGTSAGAITGANGSLVKTGAGSLTLSGANTFGGSTTVNGGTLTAAAGALAGTAGITVNAGTLGAVDANASATLSVATGATATFSGANLTLGAVTNNGTVNFTDNSAGGLVTLAGLAGTGTSNFLADATIGGAGITGGVVNVAGVLNASISGGIVTADSINASSITGGVVTILNANAHTGGNVVSGGTVRSGDNAGISSGGLTVNGATTLTSDGTTARTFTYAVALNSDVTLGATTTYTGDLTFQGDVNLGAGDRTITADSTATISGVISNGSLTKAGASTLTLSGANTYAGSTTVSAGTLATLGNGVISASSAVTVAAGATLQLGGAESLDAVSNAGTLQLGGALTLGANGGSSSLTGTVTGSGSLVKDGAGTLALATANSYAGGTTLNAGTLQVGAAGALGSGGLTLNGGTLATTGASSVVLPNAVTLTGDVALGDAATTGSVGLAGTVDLGGARTLTVATDSSITGVVSNGALTKDGAATLTLSAANTYTGRTTVNAGVLATTGFGVLASTSGVSVASGATLRIFGAETILDLNNSGTIEVVGSLTTGGDGASRTLGGALAGAGTLNKNGGGTLTLASSNSAFAGAVNVDDGVLSATAAQALGTAIVTVGDGATFAANANLGNVVTVNGGGLLKGSGTLGATTLRAGATLAPGNSPGLQTYSSLALNGGSSVQWQVCDALGARGVDYDSLAVTGTLSLAGASSANKISVNVMSLAHNADNVMGNAVNFSSTVSHQFVFATYGSLDLGTNTNLSDLFAIDVSAFLDSAGLPSASGLWSLVHSGGTIYLMVGPSAPPFTILDPGNTPDFMNVADFTLSGTGTMELSGQAYAGVYNDVVKFSGVASLGGATTVTIARFGSTQPTYGHRYVLFQGVGSPANPTQVSSFFTSTAPGTVNTSDATGRYLVVGPAAVDVGAVASPYDGLVHNADGLVHAPNEYAVYYVRGASGYNLSGIAPSLVSYVQRLCLTGPGGPLENPQTVYIPGVTTPALDPLAARLMTMTDPQLRMALSSMSPGFFGSLPGSIALGQRSQFSSLGGQLDAYRNGDGSPEGGLEGFMLVSGTSFSGGSGLDAIGFDARVNGAMAGLAKRLSPTALAGFTFGYEDSKVTQTNGSINGTTYRATGFLSSSLSGSRTGAYLDVGVSVGTTTSDSTRTTFMGTETAKPKATSYGAFLRFGDKPGTNAGFACAPYLGLDYVHVDNAGFQETGDVSAMSVKGYSYDSARATVGLGLSWNAAGALRFGVGLETFAELGGGRTADVVASFGSGGEFTTPVTVASGVGVRITPTLTYVPTPGSAVYMSLSAEHAGSTHSVGGEFGYRCRF